MSKITDYPQTITLSPEIRAQVDRVAKDLNNIVAAIEELDAKGQVLFNKLWHLVDEDENCNTDYYHYSFDRETGELTCLGFLPPDKLPEYDD